MSGNGKTSTTCKVLARKGRERSWLIQDDGGTLYRDGQFRGFEAGGLFIKTDCLNPGDQLEAYYACLRKDTFPENVFVTEDGSIDFYDILTSNARINCYLLNTGGVGEGLLLSPPRDRGRQQSPRRGLPNAQFRKAIQPIGGVKAR